MIGGVQIESRHNDRIREAKKLTQKKYRDRQGLLLVEGVRLVEEALAANLLEQLFFSHHVLSSPRVSLWLTLHMPAAWRCVSAAKGPWRN